MSHAILDYLITLHFAEAIIICVVCNSMIIADFVIRSDKSFSKLFLFCFRIEVLINPFKLLKF